MAYQSEGIRRVSAKLHSEGMTVPSNRTQADVQRVIEVLPRPLREVLERIYGLQPNTKPKAEIKLANETRRNLLFVQQDHRTALAALNRRLLAD